MERLFKATRDKAIGSSKGEASASSQPLLGNPSKSTKNRHDALGNIAELDTDGGLSPQKPLLEAQIDLSAVYTVREYAEDGTIQWYSRNWTASASFESVAIQTGRLLHYLSLCVGGTSQNRNAELLRVRLLHEEERLHKWAVRHNVRFFSQLQRLALHQNSAVVSTVDEVIRILDKWIHDSTLCLREERDHWCTTRGRASDRTTLLLESYELLEGLRNVNEAFYSPPFACLPPIPGDPTASAVRPMSVVYNQAQDSDSSGAIYSTLFRIRAPLSIVEQLIGNVAISPIHRMLENILTAFNCAAGHALDSQNIRRAQLRVLVWSQGLCNGSLRLDGILAGDKTPVVYFRRHLMGVFGDMCLILGHLLQSFDQSPDPDIAKSVTGLEASFGISNEFSEEAFDDSASLLESRGVTSLSCTSFESAILQQLNNSIDCLFDILPTISRLRQLTVLEMEKVDKLPINVEVTEDVRLDHEVTPNASPRMSPLPHPTCSSVLMKYDFNPSEAGELAFRRGDVIEVIESVYKDWWKGSLNGTVGVFPLNYVDKFFMWPALMDPQKPALDLERGSKPLGDTTNLMHLHRTSSVSTENAKSSRVGLGDGFVKPFSSPSPSYDSHGRWTPSQSRAPTAVQSARSSYSSTHWSRWTPSQDNAPTAVGSARSTPMPGGNIVRESLKSVLHTDLQLAEAIKASLRESTASNTTPAVVSAQAKSIHWDHEIRRLKDWSSTAFEKSLRHETSGDLLEKQILIFEQLAKIAAVFTGATGGPDNSKRQPELEKTLESTASAIADYGGIKPSVKLNFEKIHPEEALKILQTANDDMFKLQGLSLESFDRQMSGRTLVNDYQ